MTALISLQNVDKHYPRYTGATTGLHGLINGLLARPQASDAKAILRNINLEVQRGSSLGIIGENGAGKSTLLKLIAGVLKPSAGTIRVNGRISALLELGGSFHPDYTGYENIELAAALQGLNQREIRRNLPKIIEFADIGDYIQQPIKHYSSGMVARLGFAIATAIKPDLLITDEVLAVGDESFQKKCIRWMQDYLNEGGTLLLCAHGLFHIQTLCSQCAWIKDGRIHHYGDSFEVTQAYLAYHQAKQNACDAASHPPSAASYSLQSLALHQADNTPTDSLPMDAALTVSGEVYSPDQRPPVVTFGLVRIDGTPVYGSYSNEAEYQPTPLQPHCFGFKLYIPALPLLPGQYSVKVCTMDPEGLRVFDCRSQPLRITGKTRDKGLCHLAHHWLPYS